MIAPSNRSACLNVLVLGSALLFAPVFAGCSDTPAGSGEALDSVAGSNSDASLEELYAFADTKDASAGDAASDAATAETDAGQTGTCASAGASGCPCTANADCDGGLCIDTPNGHICAVKCVDTCPVDFSCASLNTGGADMSVVCVPKWGWLCDPCSTNADCDSPGVGKQAACLDYGNAGHFCGFDCQTTADCPSGYTCGEGKTTEGVLRKQCWFGGGVGPAATECGCSVRAQTIGLATACFASDATSGASCSGVRSCKATGLTACDAKPGKETCNGKDDDCDGKTDNDACDDQNGCTQDLCDPIAGTCTHNLLDGSPCNADNTECTANDTCQNGVCKAGAPKTCSDANPCTDDTCDPTAGCTFTNNSAACDDGKVCTQGDYCAAGVCNAGKSSSCDDGNACTDQTCDPATGNCTTAFNALNCDDGNPCSSSDACKDGVCKAGVTVDCADNDLCTLDVCDVVGGGCKHTISTGVCSDGDACTYGETCSTGVCNGGTLLNCDDLNPCTADSCDKLQGCVHAPQNGACNDGNACTDNDTCVGGSCVGAQSPPCTSDLNACTDDVCDPTNGCVYTNNTLPCSDGSVCTQTDVCAGGKCVGGATLNCTDDGNPCTTEQCNPVSGCESINNTAACDDGDGCTLKDTCSGGACKAGLPKDCSGLTTTCGTGKCATGACYLDPFPIKTVCPTGLCNGTGGCETQVPQTIDGCTAAHWTACTTWDCFACTEENGFSAYNTTDCEGTGCFDRFPSFGQNGYEIMEAQWAETAFVQWKFAKPLIGNYKIQAYIPVAIPASANAGACKADSTTTYAPKATYHLQTAGLDLTSPVVVNHQTTKGTIVTLFDGDATGLTGIRLGNGPTAAKPPACQFYLIDGIVATPQ